MAEIRLKTERGTNSRDQCLVDLRENQLPEAPPCCRILQTKKMFMRDNGPYPFLWRILHCMKNVVSYQMPIVRFLWLWQNNFGKGQEEAMNIGTSELFTAVYRLLDTQPGRHRWGVNAEGVIRQHICTRTPFSRDAGPMWAGQGDRPNCPRSIVMTLVHSKGEERNKNTM